MTKPVILTGLRANNDLHIGNYFGALLPLIDMAKNHADDYEINLFVPDLHSFTTPIDHSRLYSDIMSNLRIFAAAGLPLDHPSVHIYRQSYVPAHSELAWILDCFTGFGELSRMTEFKDKSARLGADHIGVGQFNYPPLMAADMLLYGASYVPVGEDQRQHIEFTRTIGERMNNKFGNLFIVPKAMQDQHQFFGNDQGLRIKDLADPTKKMSKSDETGKGIVFLGDKPEAAAKKIRSATTDSFGKIEAANAEQLGIKNLLQILALTTGNSLDEVSKSYEGQEQYGPLKNDAAIGVAEFLAQFQERLAKVDDAQLMAKLEDDEKQMNKIANRTLAKVQRAVGLRPAVRSSEEEDVVEYCQTLTEMGIENTVLEHPANRKPLAVVTSLGKTIQDSMPTLIMRADNGYVAAVIRGEAKADLEKIKAALGLTELRMATPEEFTEFARVPVGAAKVYNPGAQTIIDPIVFESEYLLGGSGRFDCTIRYKTADLRNIPGVKVLDITE